MKGMQLARSASTRLLKQLRPDAVALVDSFDFPDHVLSSSIGRADGNIYEDLFKSAMKSELNQVGACVSCGTIYAVNACDDFSVCSTTSVHENVFSSRGNDTKTQCGLAQSSKVSTQNVKQHIARILWGGKLRFARSFSAFVFGPSKQND